MLLHWYLQVNPFSYSPRPPPSAPSWRRCVFATSGSLHVRAHIAEGLCWRLARAEGDPQSRSSGGHLGHVLKERNRWQSAAGIPL